MIKKALLVVLSFFIPLIIIMSVYRASLGTGPLSFKYVFDVISSEFVTTSDYFSILVKDLSANLTQLLDHLAAFFAPRELEDMSWIDQALSFLGNSSAIMRIIVNLFSIPLSTVTLVLDLIVDLISLLLVFISDFLTVLKVLGNFIFAVSPYPVNKYFPVP